MKVIHHITFDCSEPEKFDWTLIKSKYKNHKSIINLIIQLIKKYKKNEEFILGLRAALICFAIKLKVKEKDNNVNKNSICNVNYDRYYFVCDCNTIYLKQKEDKDDY